MPRFHMHGGAHGARSGFDGELHMTFLDGENRGEKAQFLGPRTQVDKRLARGDLGLNDVDRGARTHDITYNNLGKQYKSNSITKEQFKTGINTADKAFITEMKGTKDAPLTATLSAKAIQLKSLAEKYGVLNSAVFSGAGLYPVGYLLKKEATKQKGGLIGIAMTLLRVLGPTALAAVVELGTKLFKGSGNGYKNSLHEATTLLDGMPHPKQVAILHKVISDMGEDAFIKKE